VLRMLKYAWFILVMKLTGFLPDFTPIMRLRGFLLRPCFRRCGRNFQICSHAMIVCSANVAIGEDVYIAYGSWVQGYGGVTLEDQVMLGPYTILASSNHSRMDGSYRFGHPQPAPIVLKRGSWTAGHVVVTAGVTVGSGAACAAGAVVIRDVPDHAIVGGVPARVLRPGPDPTGERPS
jgi:maltose O-acetyltransferase